MNRSITLATDVEAEGARVFEILSTTQGQRGFWTADCDVSADHARFGFPQAPVDLLTDVTTEPGKLVRMRVTEGFPFWAGSTWEWELGEPARAVEHAISLGLEQGARTRDIAEPGAPALGTRAMGARIVGLIAEAHRSSAPVAR